MKRAIVMACAAAAMILLAYFVLVIKNSEAGDFLKGGAFGMAIGAVLTVIIILAKRAKAANNEK